MKDKKLSEKDLSERTTKERKRFMNYMGEEIPDAKIKKTELRPDRDGFDDELARGYLGR